MKYGNEYLVRHLFRDLLVIAALIAAVVFASSAFANGNENNSHGHETGPVESTASSTSRSGSAAKAGAIAASLATGGTGGNSEGGEGGDALAEGGAASNDGNTYSSSNRSSNFYISRSLPGALNKCALSADVGGAEGGSGGFLGLQWLDHNCFMNGLSEMEDNADLKALLKCEARRFRNAVAYDRPWRERQAYCHGYVYLIYVAEIAELRQAAVEAMKHELDLLQVGKP